MFFTDELTGFVSFSIEKARNYLQKQKILTLRVSIQVF